MRRSNGGHGGIITILSSLRLSRLQELLEITRQVRDIRGLHISLGSEPCPAAFLELLPIFLCHSA